MMPLVSICTITSRPECAKWLLWNVSRIRLNAPWEWVLIVKDKALDDFHMDLVQRGDYPIELRAGNGNFCSRLMEKATAREQTAGLMRNRATRLAQGRYMAWLDDDDWHHPDKYQWMLDHLSAHEKDDYVGWSHTWLCDLARLEVAAWPCRVLINGGCAMYRREAALNARPYDSRARASDVPWVRQFVSTHKGTLWNDMRKHTLITRHTSNTGNRVQTRICRTPLASFGKDLPPEIWGDTPNKLAQLRTLLC